MATYTGKTYTGTAGSDKLVGGRGDDIFKYTLDSTRASQDIYTGGGGIDTLQLQLSYQQWLDLNTPGNNQIVACLNYLSTAKKSTSGEIASGTSFTFNFGNSTTLKIQMIEKLQVMVDVKGDGKYINLDLADDNVIAMNDTATFNVNSTAISINVLANDSVPDLVRSLTLADPIQTPWSLKYGTASTETFVTYRLNTDALAYQALGRGITATDSFFYTVTDADGDSDTAMVTVMVTGTVDHDATISDATLSDGKDDFTGSVTEAGWNNNGGTPTASGQLLVTDVDKDDNKFTVSSGTSTKGYGSYSINALGQWTYTLNNANKDVQALKKGDSLEDTFNVVSFDKTATADVTITITGADDLPVANKDVLWVTSNTSVTLPAAGLLANDTNVENRTLSVTGVLVQTGETLPNIPTLNGDGSFSFDSGASIATVGDPTPYTFTYIVDNGTEQTVTGTVEVNVFERKESDANSIDLSAQTNYAGSYLMGGTGDDIFTGGSGADVFVPTGGQDTIQNFTYDTVLDFDQIYIEALEEQLTDYKNLSWVNARVYGELFLITDSNNKPGYINVLVSSKNIVATYAGVTASFANSNLDFDFVSGYFAGVVNDLTFTVTAFDDGKEVGSASVTLQDTSRIKINFLEQSVEGVYINATFNGSFTSVDEITLIGSSSNLDTVVGDNWVLRYSDPDRIDVPDGTDVDALINEATTNESGNTVLHFNGDTLTLTGVPIGALDESWFV